VPGRSCGSCSLCCKVFSVPDVDSPRSVLCQHCIPGKGCSIHASRPAICRNFYCNWLLIETLEPEWQPEQAKMVLQTIAFSDALGLVVHVDPDFPDNWRLPPYYARIKGWALKAQQQTEANGPIYFVAVEVHRREYLILPDRDIDLGDFEDDEELQVERRVSNGRIEVLARKKPKSSPVGA
jgi:hypothetical protein